MKVSYKLEYDPAEYKNIHDTIQQFIAASKDVMIQLAQHRETAKTEGLSDNDIKIEEMNIDLQDQDQQIQLLRQELESISSILDEASEEEENDTLFGTPTEPNP